MKKKNTYLTLGIIFMMLFIGFTVLIKTVGVAAIGPLDSEVGLSSLNGKVHELFPLNETWYKISKYLGYLSFLTVGCFGVMGLWQWFSRKSLKKVDKNLWCLYGFYAVVAACYVLFEKIVINYRPVLLEEGLEASYPSSHTLLSVCIMLSSILLVCRYLADKRGAKFVLNAVFALIMIWTVGGRVLAGVHWCTDIIGSILISLSLVFFLATAITEKE